MGGNHPEPHETDEPVITPVIDKVADLEGVDPLELTPPLQSAIDTDALEDLFSGRNDAAIQVGFRYSGYDICIEGPDEVQVIDHDQ